MPHSVLQFDAIEEAAPGAKWQARWRRSWPAYEAWFVRSGGLDGPCRAEGVSALREFLPELVPVHRRLTTLAGGTDRAARFLATWCPPPYLGGCSVLAKSSGDQTRLVRNYDLSPELNEGLLLRSEWCGSPVMGMVEFLWGLSDGVNARGLTVALAYGGSRVHAEGFGITTIVRYLLEVCRTTEEALSVLERVPSHMAYNLVLADRRGHTASVELSAGGGVARITRSIATNHQTHSGAEERVPGARDLFRTAERRRHAALLHDGSVHASDLVEHFLEEPLYQKAFAEGFGTLFTAAYDPSAGALDLRWPGARWRQKLTEFEEGRRTVEYLQGIGARLVETPAAEPTRADHRASSRRPAHCPRGTGALGDLVAAYWPQIPDPLRELLDSLGPGGAAHSKPCGAAS